jgi:hypothetical protein
VTAAVAAGNTVNRGTNAAAAGGIVGDFSDALAKVEADGYDANTALGVRSLRGRLRQARATTGEQLLEAAAQNQVYGLDVIYPMRGLWPRPPGRPSDRGDRSSSILGIRQDITYKMLDQAVIQDNTGTIVYNLPQQDMVAMRVKFRVGWQVANTINYDQATEANRYPAAVLRVP